MGTYKERFCTITDSINLLSADVIALLPALNPKRFTLVGTQNDTGPITRLNDRFHCTRFSLRQLDIL